MPDHLLTFELAKDGDELFIHADAAGLRYLASALTRLAQHAEAGRKEHTHLMTEDWSGHELSSVAQGTDGSLLRQVTIHGWPKKEGDAMLWPNQSPEPTAVGAVSSAVAVHVASRRWLSFFR